MTTNRGCHLTPEFSCERPVYRRQDDREIAQPTGGCKGSHSIGARQLQRTLGGALLRLRLAAPATLDDARKGA